MRGNQQAGSYQLSAVATDNNGASSQSATVPVTVFVAEDAPRPSVSLTAPQAGEPFTAPVTINLVATAEAPPGRTLTRVDFYQGSTLLGSATQAPYTFTWPAVASGTYQVRAHAVDDIGAEGISAATTVVVSPDDRPPTVRLTSPAVAQMFLAPASVTLSAQASANQDRTITSLTFFNGQAPIATLSAPPFAYVWENVAPGYYAISAQATDSAGITTSTPSRPLQVEDNNLIPTVSILAPRSGASVAASSLLQVFARAQVSAERRVVQLDLYSGQTLIQSQSRSGTGTTDSHNFYWADVPPGMHSLTVVVTDNLGVTGTSAPVELLVSNEPVPLQIDVVEPVQGVVLSSWVNAAASAWLLGPVESVDRVEFLVTHDGAPSTHEGLRDSSARYRLSANALTAGGAYTLVARAIDASGDELARSPLRSFSRSTAPQVSITEPAAYTELAAPASLTLRGRVQMGQAGFPALDRVEVYLGQTLVSADARVSSSSSWVNFEANLTDVPEGSHQVRVLAIVSDGQVQESQLPIRVLAPTDPARLFISRPLDGAQLQEASSYEIRVGGLIGQWDDLARVELRGEGPPSGGFAGEFYGEVLRNLDSRSFGGLGIGQWRVRARATTHQGATRVTDWVSFSVYRRSISIPNAFQFAQVASPGNQMMLALAQDCEGCIAAVEFVNGETVLASVSSPPYEFGVSELPVGTYSVTARMIPVDASRGIRTSAPVTVNVVANALPTVALTSPTPGAILDLNQNVSLTATATDTDGTVAQVDFYSGEQLLGTRTAAPFSLIWQPQQPGDHVLTARATDSHGAVGISPAVNVRVGGEPPDPDARETITYIHTDLSGSPLAATNANGNVVWKENYRAYGERRLGQPGSEGQRQWFHGKEADASTGLQYFGARYYDPAVGRFMGVDPVTFQEDNLHSFNRYAYGNNNPVKFLDPDGNQAYDQKTLILIDGQGMIGPRTVNMVPGFQQQMGSAEMAANVLGLASGAPGLRPLIGWGSALLKGGAGAAKETSYLYRGVSAGHPVHDAAKQGRVVPGNVNGTVSAEAHNLGGQAANSPFTSWTRDPAIAATHAAKNGPGGLVLRVPQGAPSPGAKWSWEWSPDVWGESEVLMRGVRSGVEVLK